MDLAAEIDVTGAGVARASASAKSSAFAEPMADKTADRPFLSGIVVESNLARDRRRSRVAA